jgi:hypothetical protein
MVAAGFLLAGHQFRIGTGGTQASSAFYAAEAGLNAAIVGWDLDRVAALEPGATTVVATGRLSSGDRYVARLTRLDDARDERVAFHLLGSTGLAHGPRGGRRRVALFLHAHDPGDVCCAAALTTRGSVVVGGGAAISGHDSTPATWESVPGLCEDSAGLASPGLIIDEAELIVRRENGLIDGNPPVLEVPGDQLERVAETLWGRLAAVGPDIEYPGGLTLGRLGPVTRSDGGCDIAVSLNWGAPRSPDHPCFDYLPVIHAAGNLTITSPGSGQGILLVDGDLFIGGGFQFFGLVLVRGRLAIGLGGARVMGGTLVQSERLGGLDLANATRFGFSSCAIDRALQSPKLHLPHPLAQFAWLEILE